MMGLVGALLLAIAVFQDVDAQWAALEQQSKRVNEIITADGQTSLSPEHAPLVHGLLDQTRAFTADHPDHELALELQAQVAMMLNDVDIVDASFDRLMILAPSRKQAGLAWARYHAETDLVRSVQVMDRLIADLPDALIYHEARIRMLADLEGDSVDARLERLLQQPDGVAEAGGMLDALARRDASGSLDWADRLAQRWPDNVDVVASAARAYRGANKFADARKLLETIELDSSIHRYLYSDTLYADNHYDEAFAWMSSIDLDADDVPEGLARRLRTLIILRQRAADGWTQEQSKRLADAQRNENPMARLIINDQEVVVELFEDSAPNAVANFVAAADLGLFEGREAGWVDTGFRTIMGDRHVDDGLPYWSLPDVDPSNSRPCLPGTLTCYRESQAHSVNTTFFILHFPAPHLDGERLAFGRVVTGLDVIREMQQGDLLESVEIIRRGDGDHDPTVLDVTGRRLFLSELLSEDQPPPEGERTSSGALVRRRHCRHNTPPSAGRPWADRP